MPTNINGNTGIDKVQDGTVVSADIATLDASKLTGSIAAARIANNTIDSAHIASGAVDDAHLATGITASKLTGALPAISAANLTAIPAANITGTLPAISGANLTGITADDNTPSFGVKLSSHQSISDSTNTKINWDTEEWDTDGAFASSKFTVPSGKAGKYHFSGTVIVRNIDDGEIASLRIHLNGSDSASGLNHYRFNDQGAATNTMTFCPMSVVMDLAVGDYVELFLYHNEGSAQNVDSGYSRWSGHKLAGV